MELFHVFLPELPASHAEESAAARVLLRLVYENRYATAMPEIITDDHGKPRFADGSAHFSISHSHGHVLVALGDEPVGVDIETDRELRPGLTQRLFSPEMSAQFTPLEGWTLRESVFKLTGLGSLREMEFSRSGDDIVSPFDGVRCRLYHGEGYAAAAAAYSPLPCITELSWESLKNS